MSSSHSTSALESECSLLREWLSLAGLEKTQIREVASVALTEQIHMRFDAAKLDEDAARLLEEKKEPAWVQPMITDARWRPLLYDLCVTNPSSALLQSIVRTLSQGEHAAEVQANTSLGTVLGGASSMQTYLSSLAAQLNSLRQGQAGAQARLEGLACAAEPDFLVAQMLLRAPGIATHAEVGAHAEQAAATMALAASRAHGQAFRRLYALAHGLPRGAAMSSALISILTADSVSSADANTLQDQCTKGASTSALRDPALLRTLLASVFDPLRPPKPGLRDQLLAALACAASDARADADTAGGLTSGGGEGEGDVDMADAAGASARRPPEGTADAAARRAAALAALSQAQSICERNEVSEVGASVAALQQCARDEIAAACGVLVWARRVLTTPQFSGARFNLSFLPPVLRLLASIARAHSSLHGEVCATVHAVLMHEPPSDAEDVSSLTIVGLRRMLLDLLLWLLTEGCVFPVVAVLRAWLQDADLSLVRHLIHATLTLCAPPYSVAFGKQLLAMIKAPRTLEAHRTTEAKQPLVACAEQAGRTPGLEEEAAEALELLGANANGS